MLAQITFDWTVNVGTLIHLVTLLVGGVVLYMKMSHRMQDTERKVRTLHVWIRELMRATPGIRPEVIAAANGKELE